MKHLMTLMLAMMALVPGKQIFAQGMASAMGEMTTVVLDGPFDVSRNPALLAQEERTGALGFAFIYQPYDSYRSSADANFATPLFTTIDNDFLVFDPDTLLLIGGAAFYVRSGSVAFGMSASHSYNNEEAENLLRLTISAGPTTSRMYSESREQKRETQSNMDFAYLVAPGLSLGAQFQFKYGTSSKVEESSSYIGAVLDSEEETREDAKTYTSTLNLGALYRTSFLQAGAVVTAGDYTLKRTSYSEIEYKPPPTVAHDISDVTSLEGVYNGAPGMVLGCLSSLAGNFDVAAEAGFKIPMEYRENGLAPSGTGYEDTDITTKNRFMYLVSVGAQYRVDAGLKLACGGLMRAFSFESESVSPSTVSEQEVDYRLYSFRMGLEKKVFDSGYIVLFTALDYGTFSMSMRSTEASALSMEFDINRSVFSINAGISYIHFF